MGTNKPIVMERPQRGREMVSQQIAGQQKGKTMLMHEGYVGGAKYLVPDEDLEVMKELVDFKLGKKPMDRYVKDYEYTHLNQEPDEKFRKMSQRLHAMSSDDEEDDTTSQDEEKEKEEEVKPTRTIRFEDSVDEPSEVDSEETSTSQTEDSEKPGDPQDSVSSETSTTTGKTQSFEVQPRDVDRLRFLLSGHIRNNLRPIFIFHEYNGKSPFGKNPDFSSTKNEGDVDLSISGKFYQDSVLEETNNKLVSLNIKPEKIPIDDRSKVYEEQFYELLRVGKVNVDFKGRFVKQLDTKKYTPFLSFNVQSHPVKKTRSKKKTRKQRPDTTAYLAQPESRNLFEQERERENSENSVDRARKSERKNASQTPSAPKPGGDVSEYEPHLKKNPSRRPSMNQPTRRGRDAGDVGSEGGLVYNCDVHRRRSSRDRNIFRRLSHMFFSRN